MFQKKNRMFFNFNHSKKKKKNCRKFCFLKILRRAKISHFQKNRLFLSLSTSLYSNQNNYTQVPYFNHDYTTAAYSSMPGNSTTMRSMNILYRNNPNTINNIINHIGY